MKVLDQQCKKWHENEDKESNLAAFQKLFRTGDHRFMHQFTDEELECFSNQPVLHSLEGGVE